MNGYTPPDMSRLKLSIVTPSPAKHSHPATSSTSSVRSNSLRSKGISLNIAVSPASTSSPTPSQSSIHRRSLSSVPQNTQHLPQLPEISPHSTSTSPIPSATEGLKYKLPLPSAEQLLKLDIDDLLRLLALKEMSIIEIKDNIGTLTAKLERNENELHKLREVIQRSLYKELSGNCSKTSSKHQRQSSNPREEAIASTKNRTRRRTLSSSSYSAIISATTSTNQTQDSDNSNKRNSSLWTNLSKPLNLIQQFDSMLQNEFEKSLIPNPQQQHTTRNESLNKRSDINFHKSRRSEDSISSISSIPSPLKSKSNASLKSSNIDLNQYLSQSSDNIVTEGPKNSNKVDSFNKNTEDMLQTVSSSIWSFVNDVKTNVLSSLGEEEETILKKSSSKMEKPSDNELAMYNLETGSAISLNKQKGNTFSSASNNSPSTILKKDEDDILNNSDYEDLLDMPIDDDDKIDLSIYSNLRRK